MSEEFKNLTDQKKLFNDTESVQLEQMPDEIEMEYEYDYKESLEPMQRMFERSEEENRKYWVRKDVEKSVGKFVGEREKERQKTEKERMLKEHQEVEWMYKPVEPDVLYDKYQESYEKLNKNKTLSNSQKSKRAKSFDKKQKNMQNLESELFKTEINKENALSNHISKEKNKSRFAYNNFVAEDSVYADMVTDFVSYTSMAQKEGHERKTKDIVGMSMNDRNLFQIIDPVLKEIVETDISEFAYKTDEEFTKDLSLKITKLRALTKVEPFYNQMVADGGMATLSEGEALKIRANMKMLKIIRADYENRIVLMKNPNYVLLTENDLESKSIKSLRQINGEKGNERLAEFCNAYANIKENKLFGKGMDPETLKKKMQSEAEKEEHTETMTLYKERSKAVKEYAKKKGYKLENEDDLTGALYAYFKETYPPEEATFRVNSEVFSHYSGINREGTKAYKKSEEKELAKFARCMYRVSDMIQFGENNTIGDANRDKTNLAIAKEQGREYKAPSRTDNTQNKRLIYDNIDVCRGYREFEEKQVHERDLELYHGKFEGKVWMAMFNIDKTKNVPLHTQTFQEIRRTVILKDFENLKDEKFRPDAMGAERVKNYKKFMDGGKQEDMEKAAVKDIDNLIANIVFDNVVNGDSEDYNDEIFGLTNTLMHEKYRTEMRGWEKDTEDFYKNKISEATDVYVPLLRKLKALDEARKICRKMGKAGGQMMEGLGMNKYDREHLFGKETQKNKATENREEAEKDSKYKQVLLDRIDALEKELLQKRQEIIDSDKDSDLYAMVMKNQLLDLEKLEENISKQAYGIPEADKLIKEQKLDRRALQIFGYRYNVDSKDRPITREDEKNKEKTEAFIKDYASRDLERRRPHLERIMNELISIEIKPELFTPEYIADHMGEMKDYCDKLTYFDEIYKDEINKDFFEKLDSHSKLLIDTRIRSIYAPFSNLINVVASSKGVNLNDVRKKLDTSVADSLREQIPMIKEELLGKYNAGKEKEAKEKTEIALEKSEEKEVKEEKKEE